MPWLPSVLLSNVVIAALFALLVFSLSRVIRRPALIHGLWVVVLLKLVTPPFVKIPLPAAWIGVPQEAAPASETWAPEIASVELPRLDEAPEPRPPAADFTAPETISPEPPPAAAPRERELSVAETPRRGAIPVEERLATEEFAGDIETPSPEAVKSSEAAPPVPAPSPPSSNHSWRILGASVWLLGSVAVALLIAYRVFRFQRLLRAAMSAPQGLEEEFAELSRAMGLTKPPSLKLIPGRISPMLWLLRGRWCVLFPWELAEQLDKESRKTLLVHELAHFHRGDPWIRLLEIVVACGFWWNPVVWWARREIHRAEEDCCDAWVVSQLPDSRGIYAQALVRTMDFLSETPRRRGPRLPPLASGIGYFDEVKQRLTRIMTDTAARGLSGLGKLLVGTAALLLLPLLPTLQADPAGEQNPSANAPAKPPVDSLQRPLQLVESTDFHWSPYTLSGNDQDIYALAISSDGKRLWIAIGHPNQYVHGMVQVWDWEQRKKLASAHEPSGVAAMAVAEDGRTIAWRAQDSKRIKVADAETLEVKHTLDGEWVNELAFAPNGKQIAGFDSAGDVFAWDLASRKLIRTFSTKLRLRCFAFSPDGERIAACGKFPKNREEDRENAQSQVFLWETKTGKLLQQHRETEAKIGALAFSPNGKELAKGLAGGWGKIRNIADGKEVRRLPVYLREDPTQPQLLVNLVGTDYEDSSMYYGNSGAPQVAYSKDGKKIAILGSRAVRLWDTENGKQLGLLRSGGGLEKFAFSSDGGTIAISTGRAVQLWNVPQQRSLAVFDPQLESKESREVLAMACSSAGVIAAAYEDGAIVLRTTAGEVLRQWEGHQDTIAALAFSPDGKSLASASYDETVCLWSVSDGRKRRTFKGHGNWVAAVAFSPDGKYLASGGYDKWVRLWDAASGEELDQFASHSAAVRSVAFSPDGRWLASGGSDHKAVLWKLRDPDRGKISGEVRWAELAGVFSGHQGTVRSVAFSPDSETLASGGEDKTIKLWKTASAGQQPQPLPRTLTGHKDMVWALAFSPQGRTLASSGLGDDVLLWDPQVGALRKELFISGHEDAVTSLAFSESANALFSCSYDGTIKGWGMRPKLVSIRQAASLPGPENTVGPTAISADGRWLASGGKDRLVTLRDLRNGEVAREFRADASILDLAFSPDSRLLAAATQGQGTLLWNAATGTRRAQLLDKKGETVRRIRFSPDGRNLAAIGGRMLKLWSVERKQLLRSSPPQPSPLSSVAFSPDGKKLATSSGDPQQWQEPGVAKLWETETLREIATFAGHRHEIKQVAFTPDGERLVTTGLGSVITWNIARGEQEQFLYQPAQATFSLLSRDGEQAVVGDSRGRITFWHLPSGSVVARCQNHKGSIVSMSASSDRSLLVSASRDGSLKLWPLPQFRVTQDPRTGLPVFHNTPPKESAPPRTIEHVRAWRTFGEERKLSGLTLHHEWSTGLANAWFAVFSPDGKYLATGGKGKEVTIYETATKKEAAKIETDRAFTMHAAFSPDSRELAIGDGAKLVLWNIEQRAIVNTLTSHKKGIRRIAYSPDGGRIATASDDGQTIVWERASGRSLFVLPPVENLAVYCVAYSPNGRILATGGGDRRTRRGTEIRLWNAETGAPLRTLPGSKSIVHSLAISPDNKYLAARTPAGEAALWDLASGAQGRKIKGVQTVRSVAFSPDNRWLAAAGNSDSGYFWLVDAASGEVLAETQAGKNTTFQNTSFSPDSKFLATADTGGRVRLWSVERVPAPKAKP